MPETISAVPQNDYTFPPSPQGAEGPQFVQAKTDAIDHLVRRTSTQKQLNRSLAMSDPHWRPSSNDAKATMHRKTETSASWSSAPLQEALSAYCENKNKADRLRQDLSKTKLRDFLSQEKSGLCFTRTSLTEQEFETFIKALKNAGHGSSSSLPDLLKTAWSKVQQAAHQPASLQQSTAQSARALSDKATAPSHKGLNPIEDDGVSHISNTSPQATTSTDLLPTFFLQLLNAYLRTTNGRSFNNINVAHVKNIEKDITANKTIDTYLKLESGEVRWKDNNANITDRVLTSLLTAFEARHKKKGSLMKLLSKFSIPESGSKEYNAADKAAEPQRVNEALQTARDSVPPSQDAAQQYDRIQSAVTDLKIAHNNAPDTVPVPSPEGLNSVPRTSDGQNRSAEPYLEDNNPVPDTDNPEDNNPVPGTNNAPNKSAELNPNKNKIVADAKANSVEQTQPSNVSATSPQAEIPKNLLPNIVLKSLNNYLTTLDGCSFGGVNDAHVKKIKKDIANNEIIKQYLRLNNSELEWLDKEAVPSSNALKLLLNEFKAEHRKGGSMYKVLSPAFNILNAVDKATEPQKGDEALQAARDDESKAVSVEQAQTSNSSTTSSAATLFLQLLNKYIKTKDRQWGESINETHVKKMHRDITKNSTIGELLILKDKQLQWTRNNVTDGDLHSLLNEFRKLHNGGRSSLLQVLSDSELPAGYQQHSLTQPLP